MNGVLKIFPLSLDTNRQKQQVRGGGGSKKGSTNVYRVKVAEGKKREIKVKLK